MDYVNALPYDIRDKLTYHKEVYKQHFKLLAWLDTVATYVLGKREIRSLRFLLARTTNFGKVAERVLISHVRDGVFDDKTKQFITAKVGCNNRDWYASVAELKKMGFILVHPVVNNRKKLGTIYEIAIDCILQTTIPGDKMPALRQPRQKAININLKKSAEVIDFGAHLLSRCARLDGAIRMVDGADTDDFGAPNGTRELYKIKAKNIKLLDVPSRPQFSEETQPRVRRTPRPATSNEIDCTAAIRRTIDVAAAKSADRRIATVEAAKLGSAATLSEINAVWKQVMLDIGNAGTVAGLTVRQFAILRSSCKPHTITFTWYDFFYYVATHWGIINSVAKSNAEYARKELGDYSRDPEALYLGSDKPSIERIAYNFNKLLRLYTERAGHAVKSTLTTDDEEDLKRGVAIAQAEIERLRLANEAQARTIEALARRTAIAEAARPKTETKIVFAKPVADPSQDADLYSDNEELPDWK